MKKLFISVDLDEFYHVRWVSGSTNSLYSNRKQYFEDINGSNQCDNDLKEQTRIILDHFSYRDIQSTFFIPGEVGENYPELVKLISSFGHEIACHSYRHIDLSLHSKESFQNELIKAKELLENLVGKEVFGFRMPNLIIKDWVKDILLGCGFKYDSSICPSRSLTGKFGNYLGYPNYPYRTENNSFKLGDSEFWEFPLPVFPLLKLPGGTSHFTRAIGKWWTYITLLNIQCQGKIPSYYFHPWELGNIPSGIKMDTFYKKLYTRHTGKWMQNFLLSFIQSYHCFGYQEFLRSEGIIQ